MTDTEWVEQLSYLVDYLRGERQRATGQPAPAPHSHAGKEELWQLFRAYVNTRPPVPAASPEFLEAQDHVLQEMLALDGVHGLEEALPSPADARLRLWRGDITAFAADAIVNAANSQMLGCWQPGHHCIDNAIHTFAGVQLRAECHELMQAQGHEEPTGHAKYTSAYNLPAKWVIHTVGPIANGHPTDAHRRDLASSYRSCLDAAVACGAGSIVFCCISTGVFGFPKEEAAGIAVSTVRAWLDAHAGSEMVVVFNVFEDVDEKIYAGLLGMA